MAIFLSHKESLRYWRSSAPYFGRELMNSPIERAPFEDSVGLKRDIDGLRLDEYASEDGVLELLVSDPLRRSRSSKLKARVISGKLPERSFYRIRNGVYVCSPELLLLLAASAESIVEAIALGCELCGSYSLTEDGGRIERDPLTTVKDISRYIRKASALKGSRACLRALQFIREGSASPRETDLYMMLCLPSRLGGFALDGALLNHSIAVPEHLRSDTGMSQITPDLYWKDHDLAVEYESDERHIDVASATPMMRMRHTSDSIRRRTYEAMGKTVITVTNGEFVRFEELSKIAHLISKRIGKHGLRNSPKILAHRSRLHEWLRIPTMERRPFDSQP